MRSRSTVKIKVFHLRVDDVTWFADILNGSICIASTELGNKCGIVWNKFRSDRNIMVFDIVQNIKHAVLRVGYSFLKKAKGIRNELNLREYFIKSGLNFRFQGFESFSDIDCRPFNHLLIGGLIFNSSQTCACFGLSGVWPCKRFASLCRDLFFLWLLL